MNLSNGNGKAALVCTLSVSPNMTFSSTVPLTGEDSDLGEDAIGYAACRFLTRAHRVAAPFVKESHDLRFAKGKAGKSRRHFFVAPAVLMELPGVWAYVRVSVSAIGVLIDHVGLYQNLSEVLEETSKHRTFRYYRTQTYQAV